MKILVLGGTGFIGSHIVDCMVSKGHQVSVIGRRNKSEIKWANQGANYYSFDVEDISRLSETLQSIDYVVHALSTTIPSTADMNPVEDISSNLIFSVKLFDLLIKMDIQHILFISSGGTVYGEPETLPITESHHLQPLCQYGLTKLAIENQLIAKSNLGLLKPLIFRVSNPYGPRQGHIGTQGIITTLLDKIVLNQHIDIWGSGKQMRDFLYIDDLIDVCVSGIESGKSGIFNISSGIGYNILELINLFEISLKCKATINFKPKRSYDLDRIILANDKAKKSFNWEPKITIEQGINKLITDLNSSINEI